MFFCFFNLLVANKNNNSELKSIKYISFNLHENQIRDLIFNQNNITLYFPKIINNNIDVLERKKQNETIFIGNINSTTKNKILVFGKRILTLKIEPFNDNLLSFFMFDNYYCPCIYIYPQRKENSTIDNDFNKNNCCLLNFDIMTDSYSFFDFTTNKTVYFGTQNERDIHEIKRMNKTMFYNITNEKEETFFIDSKGIKKQIQNKIFQEEIILIPDSLLDESHKTKKKKENENMFINGSRWKLAVELIKQNSTSNDDENKELKVKFIMNGVLTFIFVAFFGIMICSSLIHRFFYRRESGYMNIDNQEKVQNL